ncbi:MAG TPA: O-antigen ligase family protein [Candidatus Baltobacteraceae bacterium]|nr:O-antigen ligase family protein [Candidatus Baltobacteraceae bacterium]
MLVLADPFALARYAGHTTLTSFKAALLGVAVALVVRGALRLPREGAARASLFALAGLIVATAATVPLAHFRAPAIRETLKAVEYALVFLFAWCAAREQPAAARLTGAACGVAVVAVVLDALRDYRHPQSGLWYHGEAITRIAGHLEGPNQLAAWLGVALPAAIAALDDALLVAVVATLGGFALALTLSRGGIAQAVAGVAGALYARVRATPRAVRVTSIVFAAAFVLALGGLAAATRSGAALVRVSSVDSSVDLGGTGSRAILWPAALAMARAHPILGVGAGNFELELPSYGAPRRVRTHANSLYLEALADGGIVLLAATIAAALVPPLALLRARGAPLVPAVAIAGLALAAHGVIDDVTFYTKVGQMWWVVAGVAAACARASSSSPSAIPGTR